MQKKGTTFSRSSPLFSTPDLWTDDKSSRIYFMKMTFLEETHPLVDSINSAIILPNVGSNVKNNKRARIGRTKSHQHAMALNGRPLQKTNDHRKLWR